MSAEGTAICLRCSSYVSPQNIVQWVDESSGQGICQECRP